MRKEHNTTSPRPVNNFRIELVVPEGHDIKTIDADVLRLEPPQ